MEIPAERGQDFVWRVEQRNKKTYLKFDVGENRENVSERNMQRLGLHRMQIFVA